MIVENGIEWTLDAAIDSLIKDIEGTMVAVESRQIGRDAWPEIMRQRRMAIDRIVRLAKLPETKA